MLDDEGVDVVGSPSPGKPVSTGGLEVHLKRVIELLKVGGSQSVVLMGPDPTGKRIELVLGREDPDLVAELRKLVPADLLDVHVEPGWEAHGAGRKT